MNTSKKIRLLTLTALFAAIIFIVTAYILHIPMPSSGGYVHLGDVFIYLAACFLPMPYAIAAAAIGAGFSDLITFPMYVIPTIIIKPLMAMWFTSKGGEFINIRNSIATVPAAVILIGGYYLAEGIITGNFVAPAANIPWNIVQAIFNTAAFFVLGLVFDVLKIKDRINNIQ